MRKFALFASVFAFSLLASLASAQQGDAMFGFGTLVSSGSNGTCSVSFVSNCVGSEKGGLFTTISGDVVFHRRIGFNMEANWRTKQALDNNPISGGILYRPILFDFNGLYQPRLGKKFGADLMGGVGWQTTRFYEYNTSFSCLDLGSCYNSYNHFLVHLGAGVRYYVWNHFFVRPEVHYYHVLNNTDVYTNSNVIRVGASLGYTIGPD